MNTPRLTFAILVLGSLSYAFAQNQNPLIGIWQNSEYGYQMTMMLNPNGTGEFDGQNIRYTQHENQLTMVIEGMSIIYNYAIRENKLILSGGDLDGSITFNKSGNSNQPITSNTPTQSQTLPPSDPPVPYAINPALIGSWSGRGETVEFKKNGQCIFMGNAYNYQATSNQIILQTNNGNATINYTLSGNQLTLIANGEQAVYTKDGSQNTPNTGSGKGVAMELMGKWCWINVSSNKMSSSSRCIVFNADGTYTYYSESSMSVNTTDLYGGTASQNSDRGTWYVEGDRIYYDSQSSGQGSYRLEKRNHPKNVNDPMIILDGEAYVTATARQPWR